VRTPALPPEPVRPAPPAVEPITTANVQDHEEEERDDLALIPKEAADAMASDDPDDETTPKTYERVIQGARKVYRVVLKETGSEERARAKARETAGKMARKAVKGKLPKDAARDLVNDAIDKREEIRISPLPTIEQVAVKAMGKFNRFLTVEDKDNETVRELFRSLGYLPQKHRDDLYKCLSRLRGTLDELEESGRTSEAEVDGPRRRDVGTGPEQLG
jgi:hypothetical protein